MKFGEKSHCGGCEGARRKAVSAGAPARPRCTKGVEVQAGSLLQWVVVACVSVEARNRCVAAFCAANRALSAAQNVQIASNVVRVRAAARAVAIRAPVGIAAAVAVTCAPAVRASGAAAAKIAAAAAYQAPSFAVRLCTPLQQINS